MGGVQGKGWKWGRKSPAPPHPESRQGRCCVPQFPHRSWEELLSQSWVMAELLGAFIKKCVSAQKGWVSEKTQTPPKPDFPVFSPTARKNGNELKQEEQPKKAFQKDLGPLWDMGHNGGDAPCAVPVPLLRSPGFGSIRAHFWVCKSGLYRDILGAGKDGGRAG